mgnify:CR=1 FL=1
MKLGLDYRSSNHTIRDNYLLLRTYNNIGFTFYLNKQADSAKVYYTKTIDFNNVIKNHSDIYGLATRNLGQIHFQNKD